MKDTDIAALVEKRVEEELARREKDADEAAKKMRERWTAHFDEREKTLEGLINEARARNAALDTIMEREPKPKDWDWKRGILAGFSAVAGGALAYFLHSKCPALNQAACGMTGGIVLEELHFKGQVPSFGVAVGSITGIWATDNMPVLSMGLAGVAYAKVTFDICEDVAEAFKQYEAEKKKKEAAKPADKKAKAA